MHRSASMRVNVAPSQTTTTSTNTSKCRMELCTGPERWSNIIKTLTAQRYSGRHDGCLP